MSVQEAGGGCVLLLLVLLLLVPYLLSNDLLWYCKLDYEAAQIFTGSSVWSQKWTFGDVQKVQLTLKKIILLFPAWKVSCASVHVKCDSPLVLIPGGLFEVVGSELSSAYVSEILGSLSEQCSEGCEVLGGCRSIIACLTHHFCYSLLVETGAVLWKRVEDETPEVSPWRSVKPRQVTVALLPENLADCMDEDLFPQNSWKPWYFLCFYTCIKNVQHNS